ncbi:MAG: hypothetical protein ACYTGB_16410, partial [Planctomycetota bacterium]
MATKVIGGIRSAAAIGVMVVALGVGDVGAARSAAAGPPAAVGAAVPEALKSAPSNTWVKLTDEKTGGRASPAFFYEPGLRIFFLTAGVPGGAWGDAERHYIVETFNLKTCKWSNAYPPGAPWKNQSGPTDAPTPSADDGVLPLKEIDGILSLYFVTSPYRTDSKAHFQWAHDADSRQLFAYLFDKTVTYDPVGRAWKDTGAERFSKGRWAMQGGNMCYDPVNKEILSIGGSSDEPGGTPGTYVFEIARNVWRKVPQGSKELNDLYAESKALRRRAHALLSACRSRYFITESEAEARARLSETAAALEADIARLVAEVKTATLPEDEAEGGKPGAERLSEASSRLKAVSGRLDGQMNPELIAELRRVLDSLDVAQLDLAPEPPGRAHSQPA